VTSWGQPEDAIIQFAYVVEEIDDAMRRYVEKLGVGPWFRRGPFTPPRARYRGGPSTATFSVARAFSGHAMVELIQQHDDGPSVFHPAVPRRYGFHHWARMTGEFDAEVERCAALGWEEAFFDVVPSGARVVYVDATPDLPGLLELVERTPEQEQVYTAIYRAAVDWDGRDPIREG
jgi:Glyoxalase/Bleomycin resistance protein/Dioxygenase superfamily